MPNRNPATGNERTLPVYRRLLTAVAVLTVVLAMPGVVFAQAVCSSQPRTGNGQHYWIGYEERKGSGDGELRGVEAQIENQDPFVSLNSLSSTWVMLNNPNVGANGAYLQAGFLDENVWGITRRVMFIEADWDGNNTWDHHEEFSEDDAPADHYEIFKVAVDKSVTPAKFRVYIGGFLKQSFDLHFTPTVAQVLSEVGSSGDQMSGGVSDPTNWYDARYKVGSSDWYEIRTGPYTHDGYNTNSDWFARSLGTIGTGNFRTWDKYC